MKTAAWYRFLLGTLRGRLMLGVAAVHAVMMSLLIVDLTLRQHAMILDRQIEEASALSQTLATSAAGWILADDISGLQELVEAQRRYPGVVFAILVDAQGRVLAHTDRARPGRYMLDLPREVRQTTLAETPSLVDIATPAMVGGHHVGWARVGIGQKAAGEKLAEITRSGVIYALAAILLGSVAAWFMASVFTRRLQAIQKTIDAVRSGNHMARSSIAGEDEAAVMAREFDTMLDALAERDDELRKSKETVVESNRWLQSILDAASEVAIIATNADGVISLFNRGAERMLGYRADELVGKETPARFHLAAEFEERGRELSKELGVSVSGFRTFVVKAESDGQELREWTYVRHDDIRIRVSLVVTTVRSVQGDITGYLGIAQDITERKQAEVALHRLNRELRAISDCNQTLMHAEDEQALLDEICRIVCAEAGYRMAWVGYAERDEAKTLRPVAWAGAETGYLEQARFTWADTERGRGPSGMAIRTGEIACIDDFAIDPKGAPWRQAALQRGYRSSIALPLQDEGAKLFGALNIYSAEANAFTAEEQRLLAELAGDLAYGIVTLRTRVERNQAEQQLGIAATAFEAQLGIVITDAELTVLRVNRAFTEITGYAPEDIVGATPRLLKSGRHDVAFYRAMWEDIKGKGSWQGEIWNRRKNGELYPEWLIITAVNSPRGELTHYVGTLTDITERKAAEKEIEHLAFYDLLTELPNRRLLVDRLQQAMAGSARNRRMGALLFIDLDNFKMINDTCGHDVGDLLLIEVAHRLGACVRDGDTISRLGGDEFVVMLEDLSEAPAEAASLAKIVAEKILAALNQPYTMAGRVHHSTPSIGATLFVDHENSVDELLKQADIAMYQAKSAGRNTLRFFDPDMQAALAAQADTEASLRLGIQGRQFVLHYQPQVDGAQRILGAEALLRWQHPQHGMVAPDQFIPLAEETGLILSIGQWVLEEACAQLAVWSREARSRDLRLAVNVSARQFRQDDFVDRVRQALASSGAPATRLKLELTESLVLDNVADTIEKMSALKQLGVGFSMDDFGTGYSSLAYLTRLPLDQLKIDQSFIRNLPDNASDAVVVQAIITLASSLGLAVIAEGVETEAQRLFLDRHGCPIYQGYLFSKAVPLATFDTLLARQ